MLRRQDLLIRQHKAHLKNDAGSQRMDFPPGMIIDHVFSLVEAAFQRDVGGVIERDALTQENIVARIRARIRLGDDITRYQLAVVDARIGVNRNQASAR